MVFYVIISIKTIENKMAMLTCTHVGCDRVFVCSKCGGIYASSQSLWNHKQRCEMDRKWHRCIKCGKNLSSYRSLWRHKKICKNVGDCSGSTVGSGAGSTVNVMGAAMSKCNKCPKQYKHRSSLSRHKKYDHAATEVCVSDTYPCCIDIDIESPSDDVSDIETEMLTRNKIYLSKVELGKMISGVLDDGMVCEKTLTGVDKHMLSLYLNHDAKYGC